MKFIEAMKIRVRMCTKRPGDYFSCCGCPLSSNDNGFDMNCAELLIYHPEKAEEILTKWAEEHPQKTILQDFLEKYPNAPLKKDGTPQYVCPYQLGYDKSDDCIYEDTYTCCKKCWNRPLEE